MMMRHVTILLEGVARSLCAVLPKLRIECFSGAPLRRWIRGLRGENVDAIGIEPVHTRVDSCGRVDSGRPEGRWTLARDDSCSNHRRPDRSAKRAVEGPPLHKKLLLAERRSLHYASLRSTPVGTTGDSTRSHPALDRSPQPGIEQVADAVAQQLEGQRGQRDRGAGKEH